LAYVLNIIQLQDYFSAIHHLHTVALLENVVCWMLNRSMANVRSLYYLLFLVQQTIFLMFLRFPENLALRELFFSTTIVPSRWQKFASFLRIASNRVFANGFWKAVWEVATVAGIQNSAQSYAVICVLVFHASPITFHF
jgi:hypothetical protein